jgi:cbb3-type cytochrome oxidase cytochrome c subunit
MDQIGARRKKLVAGALLYDTVFRYTGKRATTSLIEIGDRYNDIPYISSLLQICSGQ